MNPVTRDRHCGMSLEGKRKKACSLVFLKDT